MEPARCASTRCSEQRGRRNAPRSPRPPYSRPPIGGQDLAADLGIKGPAKGWNALRKERRHPRPEPTVYSRSYGYTDINNQEGSEQAKMSVSGLPAGRHSPSQIAIIHEAFSPDEKEVRKPSASSGGKNRRARTGVVAVDGRSGRARRRAGCADARTCPSRGMEVGSMKPENLVKNAIGREVPTSVRGLGGSSYAPARTFGRKHL